MVMHDDDDDDFLLCSGSIGFILVIDVIGGFETNRIESSYG